MFKRLVVTVLAVSLALSAPAWSDAQQKAEPPAKNEGMTTEQKAAVLAAIVAASVAAYLAMGKPCACPYNSMRNGRSCGGTSAWSKAGGCKPLCYPTDVTEAIFRGWLTAKKLPDVC